MYLYVLYLYLTYILLINFERVFSYSFVKMWTWYAKLALKLKAMYQTQLNFSIRLNISFKVA